MLNIDVIYPLSLHSNFLPVTSLRLTIIHNHDADDKLLRDGLMGLKLLNHLEIQFMTYRRPTTAILLALEFLHVYLIDASEIGVNNLFKQYLFKQHL